VRLLDRRCLIRDAATSSALCTDAGAASILGEARDFVVETAGAFRCVGYDADVAGARGRKVDGRRVSASGRKLRGETQSSQRSPPVGEFILGVLLRKSGILQLEWRIWLLGG